jgi:hypothetical protein
MIYTSAPTSQTSWFGSGRRLCDAPRFTPFAPLFPPFVWRSDAPSKCKFYSCLAIQGKCLTADNLAKRGWTHNLLCTLCNSDQETALHLLAACPYAQDVWSLVINHARLPLSIMPPLDSASLTDWLAISVCRANKGSSKLWRSVIPLVWWSLWNERNGRFSQSCS